MAKRHPGSRRTKHQSSQDPDDVLVAGALHAVKWAEGNQQALWGVGAVIVITVLGFMSYGNSRERLYQEAGRQLEIVYDALSIQDQEGAKDELVTFLDRFGGTPYEAEARLLLGELYLQTGSPQQAQVVLERLGTSPRDPIEFQGAALLGGAYEQDQRWSEAEEVYLAIADRSELDFQVRGALEAAARIRNARGDAEGAIELYERVLSSLDEEDFPAPARGLYEMRIQEIRSAAGS